MKPSFSHFITLLKHSLDTPLPGVKAHLKLEPATRKKFDQNPDLNLAIPSAVLSIFFSEGCQIRLLFIQRPIYDGVHSGQIAFPGGRFEVTDEDLLFTALRETYEEIGINFENVNIIGQLSELYIPPSNFIVTPFVGYVNDKPEIKINETEVAEVFSLDIENLLDENAFQIRRVNGKNYAFDAPCFFVENKLIWGATAMILNELLTIIKYLDFSSTNKK